MLHLDDFWVWDLWLADDNSNYHIFFLYAPRVLGDPDDRHFHARIGHAVSADLVSWERLPDPLGGAPWSGFDDLATWTGSVAKGDDGRWYLFYTAVSSAESGLVQRVGLATSEDLTFWDRAGPVVLTDRRWYETLDLSASHDQAWRDPWVLRDPNGSQWHMLLTARANYGPPDDRGVIGHATSPNLLDWIVQPPLSRPGQGFGQLEVPQAEVIEGCPVLLFSCLGKELAGRKAGEAGGIWLARGESLLGEWDIQGAQRLSDETLYAGRAVRDRRGGWALLAFLNRGQREPFVGDITNPIPLSVAFADGSSPFRPRLSRS